MLNHLKNIFNYLLPAACVLCGDKGGPTTNLCESCQQALPWLSKTCAGCAMPLFTEVSEPLLCGDCLQQSPPFKRVYALCRYEEPIDRLITALKFNHRLVYARLLSELLAEQVQKNWYQQKKLPDCLIPMPLHKQRLRERGFNQAVEIARPIAKKLKIPLELRACQRARATQTQTSLPAAARHANVKNAFVIKPGFAIKHVAVLDDVMTTGHTLRELAKVLQRAGVEQIDVWCCARTVASTHNIQVN